MRRAALRTVLVFAVTIAGVVAGSSAASAGDPLESLDPVVSTVLGQTTVVGDVTGDVTGGDADLGSVSGSLPGTGDVTGGSGGDSTDGGVVGDTVGVVGDTADTLTGGSGGSGSSLDGTVDGTVDGLVGTVDGTLDGTATGSGTIIGDAGTIIGGSGTVSSGDVARLAGAPLATVFDRLPPRVEMLLERILLGDRVAASLRRLERLLESAPPELRDRIVRLIRTEIRRLERHGVANGERRIIHRLRLALRIVTGAGADAAVGTVAVHQLSPLAVGDGRTATMQPLAASTRASAGGAVSAAAGSEGDDGSSSPWAGAKGLSLLILIALLGALSLALIAFSKAPVDLLPPGRLQKLRTSAGFEIGVSAYVLLAGACALLVLTHVSSAISL